MLLRVRDDPKGVASVTDALVWPTPCWPNLQSTGRSFTRPRRAHRMMAQAGFARKDHDVRRAWSHREGGTDHDRSFARGWKASTRHPAGSRQGRDVRNARL